MTLYQIQSLLFLTFANCSDHNRVHCQLSPYSLLHNSFHQSYILGLRKKVHIASLKAPHRPVYWELQQADPEVFTSFRSRRPCYIAGTISSTAISRIRTFFYVPCGLLSSYNNDIPFTR